MKAPNGHVAEVKVVIGDEPAREGVCGKGLSGKRNTGEVYSEGIDDKLVLFEDITAPRLVGVQLRLKFHLHQTGAAV